MLPSSRACTPMTAKTMARATSTKNVNESLPPAPGCHAASLSNPTAAEISEAVVFPDVIDAFPLVADRGGGSMGVVACRVVVPPGGRGCRRLLDCCKSTNSPLGAGRRAAGGGRPHPGRARCGRAGMTAAAGPGPTPRPSCPSDTAAHASGCRRRSRTGEPDGHTREGPKWTPCPRWHTTATTGPPGRRVGVDTLRAAKRPCSHARHRPQSPDRMSCRTAAVTWWGR